MKSNDYFSNNQIAPERVIRGKNAWENSKKLIPSFSKKPLILGRSSATEAFTYKINKDLKELNISPMMEKLKYDCCEEDLARIENLAQINNCDSIITAGGGKVLDAGKLIADRLSIPCTTIPLSAATCAGWTALSNIYSPQGAFIRDQSLKSCPKLLIFDHGFVRSAPKKTLASGISDALAKWYEASLSSSKSTDGFVQQAVQMARVLRDQLFIDGKIAYEDSTSDAWARVAEGCALTAGLIGGIGGPSCRTAAAHPIHNGITQLNHPKLSLHGEIVGFGILVQLRLEELHSKNKLAKQARMQLKKYMKEINLPTDISSLGYEKVKSIELKEICKYIYMNEISLKSLPFYIDEKSLYKTIIDLDKENSLIDINTF